MLAAQTILLKEIAQIAGANEIALGTALSAWILWTAAGTILYRGLGRGKAEGTSEEKSNAGGRTEICIGKDKYIPKDFLFYAKAAAFVFLPVTALLRLSPAIMPAGLKPGMGAALIAPLIFCAAPGLLNGMAAGAALCRVPARFYGAEAAGAAAAGLFCTAAFYFFPGLSRMAIAALAAAPLFLPAYKAKHRPDFLRFRSAVLFLLFSVIFILFEQHFYRLVPPAPVPQRITETRAARLAFAADGSIYSDGSLVYSPEAAESREETVHIPLLSLPVPKKIITAGASAYGLSGEIIKHLMAEKGELLIADPDFNHSRIMLDKTGSGSRAVIKITNADLRALAAESAKNKNTAEDKADIIFMAVPAPSNAALNRYYTLEAFALYKNLLRPDGHIIFSLPAGYNTVPRHRLKTISSIIQAAEKTFPNISVFPSGGDFIIILSGLEGSSPDFSSLSLIGEYRKRKISSRYVIPENIPVLSDSYRLEWAGEIIKTALKQKKRINSDDMPAAYLSDALSWADSMGDRKTGRAAVPAAAILSAAFLFFFRRKTAVLPKETISIFLLGAWSLSLETALIFRYQAVTGEMSPFIGAIFAVFMAGCAAGSLIEIPFFKGAKGAENCIKTGGTAGTARTALCIYAAMRGSISAALIWLSLAAAGISGGLMFRGLSQKAGTGPALYSAELIGSAAGGFITAAAAFPAAGMPGTLFMAAAAIISALLISVFGIIKAEFI